MNPFDRVDAALSFVINRSRAGSSHFDHFWKARTRYGETFGPRLAAAIAYYGFFAAFAVGLLGYSILGFVLGGDPAVLGTVDAYLHNNLPFLNPAAIQNARNTVAVFGLIGLVFAGIGWVDGMRSSQRAMWRLEQQPGNWALRRLIDLGMLIGLGVLLYFALWVVSGVRDLAGFALDSLWPGSTAASGGGSGFLRWFGEGLTVLVNLLMSAGLLLAVPRLWVSPRRIAGPVLLVGLGLSVLTTVGRIYVHHTEENPAYKLAGAAVGLLVFLNLFSQLLLFGAALAATGHRGTVTDLARGRDLSEAAPGGGTGLAEGPRAPEASPTGPDALPSSRPPVD